MNDSPSWSLPVGRWHRTTIRVHAMFVVVGVLALFLATHDPAQSAVGFGVLSVAILFASVLAHELGHSFAAARVGGNRDQIVIGPLGGLSQTDLPRDPQAELIATLAGPLVNLGILLLVLPVLFFAGIGVPQLVSPVAPLGLLEGSWWTVTLKLTFWMNWLILVANMLPAFPLDGAHILRTIVWPALGFRGATQVAVRASKLTALGVCLLAWLTHDGQPTAVLPTWVPLVLLATFIYFNVQHEGARLDEGDWNEDMFSYDFSQGYTSLERSPEPHRRSGGVRRWLDKRREQRRQRRRWQELEEERQVDEILLRLHESGMNGLTSKQRALLNRVSARYRNRQQS